MAILPTAGRTALAIAIMAQPLHCAWGTGDPLWDTDQTAVQHTFSGDVINLAPPAGAPVSNVVVKSLDGLTTYVVDTDYTVNLATGLITRLGTGAIAGGATVVVDHHIGRPAESMDAVALLAEVGRRSVTTKQYVVASETGSIIVPEGRFEPSAVPTNMIHVVINFDYVDAPAAVIRELAVYLGTVVKDTVPAGQVYFEPGDIQDPGTLLALQHIPPINRSASVRQSFEFVLTQ